jgi:catechol 2,3-dioxygenase-like lactoylglutathione lyase family enzyme
MDMDLAAIGIELVVENLDRAVELFVDVLGFDLISRGPAAFVPGEVAAIDAGNIVISLMMPATSGPNALLSGRQARLSQLIFGAMGRDGVTGVFERSVAAGLSMTDLPEGRFAIVPESIRGALGIDVAVVTVPVTAE